jgi:hypothetical protein
MFATDAAVLDRRLTAMVQSVCDADPRPSINAAPTRWARSPPAAPVWPAVATPPIVGR